ncbi:hypothetical protein [Trueperella sp. LYQ143]|uniref:hypothetical protein n=1 Tax=unclassified Trueperella TaxID=2630174 RepID=UPI003983298C
MRERYWVDVLTREGVLVGRLDRFTSLSLTGNVNRQIRWDGQMETQGDPGVDWWRHRIRPMYQRDEAAPVALGVYLVEPESCKETEGLTHSRGSLSFNLYDRTRIPSLDKVEQVHTEVAGSKVTARIKALLESTGEKGVAITDRDETLRTDMVFDPGTSKLRIINDLLDAAGFFALYTDYSGQYRVTPYTAPNLRPVVRVYTPGGRDLYEPQVTTSFPETAANKVILQARGDGDAPDLIAVAQDREDFARTGTWRAIHDESVEATSQAVLDGMAQRRLREAQQATWTRSRSVEVSPLELNSVIAGRDGGRETVEEIRITCQAGALMMVTSREVRGG